MAPKKQGAKDDNAERGLGVAFLPPVIRNLIALPSGARQAKPSSKPLALRAPSSLNLKAIRTAQRTPPTLDLYAQSRARQKLKPKAASSTVAGLLGKRVAALAENDRKPGLLSRRGVLEPKAMKPSATKRTATKAKATKAKATKRTATKRKTDADAPTFPIPTTAKPERSGGSDDE